MISANRLGDFFINFLNFLAYKQVLIQPLDSGCINLKYHVKNSNIIKTIHKYGVHAFQKLIGICAWSWKNINPDRYKTIQIQNNSMKRYYDWDSSEKPIGPEIFAYQEISPLLLKIHEMCWIYSPLQTNMWSKGFCHRERDTPCSLNITVARGISEAPMLCLIPVLHCIECFTLYTTNR